MNKWPKDDPQELANFYGTHELDADGTPSERWERTNLAVWDVPYPMVLAWDKSQIVHKIRCHEMVRASLSTILEQILKLYGDPKGVSAAKMDLYGGCYNYRATRGLARLSVHAWGAAIDLDPDSNPLGIAWKKDKGMMPMDVVNLFEAEGWQWGGRWTKRPDPMHFQATSA